MCWSLLRSLLFLLSPERAHHLGAFGLKLLGIFGPRKNNAQRGAGRRQPQFTLAGFSLNSPLGIAAGFDKGANLICGLQRLGFSFIEVGTVTPEPQPGNPEPRLFRLPHSRALINRMGFNSEGMEVVAARLELLRSRYKLDFPVGMNLGKNRNTPVEKAGDDYEKALRRLYSLSDYIVINLSSPNTPSLTDLQEESYLQPLLRRMRGCRDQCAKNTGGDGGSPRPLFLKISPDLKPAARKTAVEIAINEGFSGIIATNTSRRRDFPGIDPRDSKSTLAEEGGLSGAPLGLEAIETIKEIRSIMGPKPCLISVGGLDGIEDAKARLAAGANLLQVYTEFVYAGPSYPRKFLGNF